MSDEIIKQLKEIKPLRTMSMYVNKEELLRDKCWDKYSRSACEADCAPYNVIYKEQFDELYKNDIQQLKQQLEALIKRNEELKLHGQQCVSAYYELVGMLDNQTLEQSKKINFCWKDCYAVFGKDLNFESKPDFTKFAKSITETRDENKQLKQQLEDVKKERDEYYNKMTIANVRYTQEREKNKEAVELIERLCIDDIGIGLKQMSRDELLEIVTNADNQLRQFLAKYRGENG